MTDLHARTEPVPDEDIRAGAAGPDHGRPLGGDLPWGVLAVLLIAAAAVVGGLLTRGGAKLFVGAPPLFAQWMPHVGPGTLPAVGLALAAVVLAPRLVRRLRWRRLLVLGCTNAVAWTLSLALVDGWQRGVTARLEDVNEYLHEIPRIGDIDGFLSTFTDHILDFQPGRWTTHVSSHPPLATLFFVALDRIGLGGGAWAGVAVIAVGSLAAVAVPVTLRALGAPRAARAVWPFVVVFPGAVWVGVSADGMFLGASAVGIALVTLGVTGRRPMRSWLLAVAGGVLLGCALYLFYGLALLGVPVAAIALLTGIRARSSGGGRWWRSWLLRWVLATGGVLAVVAVFTVAGFSWTEGLDLLHTRYYQGIASQRPYHYFVWANLAALAVSAGPAVFVSVARSGAVLRRVLRRDGASAERLQVPRLRGRLVRPELLVPAVLTLAALLAVLAADVTGLSKAETERIWLPFGVWLLCGLALLPSRRARWVIGLQTATALLVNHLLLTHW